MTHGDSNGNAEKVTRTVQVIAGSIMAGMVFFGVVAFVISMGKEPGDPLIGYIAAGFTAVTAIAANIVPGILVQAMIRKQRSATEQDEPAQQSDSSAGFYVVFQIKTIVEYALLEGAAFFCLVAYIVTVQLWTIAIAAAVLAKMAVAFPTRTRIDNWVQEQRHL